MSKEFENARERNSIRDKDDSIIGGEKLDMVAKSVFNVGIPRIPSGFTEWNEKNGGIPNSAVFVVGSNSNGGRSMFLHWQAKFHAENGLEVAFFPLGSSEDEIDKMNKRSLIMYRSYYPSDEFDPFEIVNVLRKRKRVDVLYIDDIEKACPFGKDINHFLTNVIGGFKRVAIALGIPVILSLKLNDEGELNEVSDFISFPDMAWFWYANPNKRPKFVIIKPFKSRFWEQSPMKIEINWDKGLFSNLKFGKYENEKLAFN